MIASVRGQVVAVGADSAVVEVGGVGLRVHLAPATLTGLRVGQPARLSTSLVVREDALTLYGFADDDARDLFDLLQTATGVGPRLAQAVLSVLAPDVVRKALANGETGVLTQVPGIGRKTAERLVLELRDKVGPAPAAGAVPAGDAAGWRDQVRTGLIGLGWSAAQADHAVAEVEKSLGDEIPPVPQLLKQAIRMLGSPR